MAETRTIEKSEKQLFAAQIESEVQMLNLGASSSADEISTRKPKKGVQKDEAVAKARL